MKKTQTVRIFCILFLLIGILLLTACGKKQEVATTDRKSGVLSVQNGKGQWGEGFLITEAGDIVVPSDLVDDGQDVKVQLPDGTQTAARVISNNPDTNVALVRADDPNAVRDSGVQPIRVDQGSAAQVKQDEYVYILHTVNGQQLRSQAKVLEKNSKDGTDYILAEFTGSKTGLNGCPVYSDSGTFVGTVAYAADDSNQIVIMPAEALNREINNQNNNPQVVIRTPDQDTQNQYSRIVVSEPTTPAEQTDLQTGEKTEKEVPEPVNPVEPVTVPTPDKQVPDKAAPESPAQPEPNSPEEQRGPEEIKEDEEASEEESIDRGEAYSSEEPEKDALEEVTENAMFLNFLYALGQDQGLDILRTGYDCQNADDQKRLLASLAGQRGVDVSALILPVGRQLSCSALSPVVIMNSEENLLWAAQNVFHVDEAGYEQFRENAAQYGRRISPVYYEGVIGYADGSYYSGSFEKESVGEQITIQAAEKTDSLYRITFDYSSNLFQGVLTAELEVKVEEGTEYCSLYRIIRQ